MLCCHNMQHLFTQHYPGVSSKSLLELLVQAITRLLGRFHGWGLCVKGVDWAETLNSISLAFLTPAAPIKTPRPAKLKVQCQGHLRQQWRLTWVGLDRGWWWGRGWWCRWGPSPAPTRSCARPPSARSTTPELSSSTVFKPRFANPTFCTMTLLASRRVIVTPMTRNTLCHPFWGHLPMNCSSLMQRRRQMEKKGRRQPLNTWATRITTRRSTERL